MTIAPSVQGLQEADGFRVVGPDGDIGTVEEVWLDGDGAATGVALRTDAGRRGLLRAADVEAVEAERRWVVVSSEARLLELDPPRLVRGPARQGRLEAAWTTTGATLDVAPPEPERPERPHPPPIEPSLLRSIVVLYAGIAVVVVVIMALAFGIAYLVG